MAGHQSRQGGVDGFGGDGWEAELAGGRFCAVGRLAAGVAHELCNPLSIILGCSHLALDSLPPGHAAKSQLRAIERATLRCRGLLRELVEFAAAGAAPEPNSPIDLGETLAASLALVAPLARHRCLELVQDLGARRLPHLGRARALQTAFVHLAAHVCESYGFGGRLEVRARACDGAAEITFVTRLAGAAPRSRGPEPGRVGLAVAAEILRRHGGTVSHLGAQGLRVTLPLAAARPARCEKQSASR